MKLVTGSLFLAAAILAMLSLSGSDHRTLQIRPQPELAAPNEAEQNDKPEPPEPQKPIFRPSAKLTEGAALLTVTGVTMPLTADSTPPTVKGKDFEITQGDSVSYKKKIKVSDDRDKHPVIEIDNSAVDLDTPGVYPVVYKVTDNAGNSTDLTLMMTVNEYIPDKAATEEYVLYLARGILDEITDDSMSDLQKAYTVYRWTKNNIAYIGTSDKSDWVIGAYDGFTKRSGDCYNYFATAKALLAAAGIETADISQDPSVSAYSSHYWLLVNVGDGWYHFDPTPSRYYGSNFFMLTDEEIHAWDDRYYKGDHAYLADDLPKVAKRSIQNKVDYSSAKLKE